MEQMYKAFTAQCATIRWKREDETFVLSVLQRQNASVSTERPYPPTESEETDHQDGFDYPNSKNM